MSDAIIFSRAGRTARITLNCPEAGNAINSRMAGELSDVCVQISREKEIYAVMVTGAGDKFCTGGELEPEEKSGIAALAALECPVIAGINGDALDEGLELALACDIRLASDTARFGMTQVARGVLPAEGGTQRLPRVVGRGKALEMILTAETLSAAEAVEIGLVSRVFQAGQLDNELLKLAESIAAKGPIALKYIKEAVNKGMDMTLEQGLRLEGDLYFLLHTTVDRTEGIKAFQEKRKPEFKGE